MSIPLQPLPDHDLLKASEVGAALGISSRVMAYHLKHGRFPGAFRTPGLKTSIGQWRIPRDAAIQVGRELGVWDDPDRTRQQLIDDLPPDNSTIVIQAVRP